MSLKQISPAGWTPIEDNDRQSDYIASKPVSQLRETLYQFSRRRTAIIGVVLVALTILFAVVGPMFRSYSYDEQQLGYVSVSPLLKVYEVGDKLYYVPTSGKLIEVDDGYMGESIRSKRDDGMNKRFIYEIDEVTYYLNYRNNPFTLEDTEGNVLPTHYVLNRTYPLGTDGLGRDILVRLMYGARISLTVAFVATLVTLLIGILYGSLSAYLGGTVDVVMMRIVDVISSIPLTMYVILIMVLFGNGGLKSIIIALGSVYWVDMARIVRGEILTLKKREYVSAARTMGSSTWYVLTRHLIPNAIGPIIVTATMQIPSAIFTEAFMSFIGLGVSAPMASWGMMCNDALETLQLAPYQLAFPAGAICLAMFAFNFIGDGMRDAFDPRLRK